MKKNQKKFIHYNGRRPVWPSVLKVVFSLAGLLVLLAVCLLLFFVITEYRPADSARVAVEGRSIRPFARVGQTYSALTFDIGYAGLDAAQDHFSEGGRRAVAENRETVEENLSAILDVAGNGYDFLFFQEVDTDSRRSLGVDQRAALSSLLESYVSCFALDYKSPFVPFPLSQAVGRVESGLMSFSQLSIRDSARVRFDGGMPFPERLFVPNRCFLVLRMAVEGGGELVLVNTRFAPFGEDGAARDAQFAQMRTFLEAEAEKGHYVVVGADFSHLLPGAPAPAAPPAGYTGLPAQAMPTGFHLAVDTDTPTRRSLSAPYTEETPTFTTDGFWLSDNVTLVSVQTKDLGFQNAAHNPVTITFTLSPPIPPDPSAVSG
ncbi:MAG: hypothetical protein LBC26_07170 [Oscillospiraceae bacterium]|nr:hypothetical protein [Oscillospiraceae bacterium]